MLVGPHIHDLLASPFCTGRSVLCQVVWKPGSAKVMAADCWDGASSCASGFVEGPTPAKEGLRYPNATGVPDSSKASPTTVAAAFISLVLFTYFLLFIPHLAHSRDGALR